MAKEPKIMWAFRYPKGQPCVPYPVEWMKTTDDGTAYCRYVPGGERFTIPSSYLAHTKEAAKTAAMTECEEDIYQAVRLLKELAAS